MRFAMFPVACMLPGIVHDMRRMHDLPMTEPMHSGQSGMRIMPILRLNRQVDDAKQKRAGSEPYNERFHMLVLSIGPIYGFTPHAEGQI